MEKARPVAKMVRLAHARTVLPDHESFTSKMAVRLTNRSPIRDAVQFARSEEMVGRTFVPLMWGEGMRWEFENIEDGVLFRLKFDGRVEPPIDMKDYLNMGDK